MDDKRGHEEFSFQAARYGMNITGGVTGPVTFLGGRAALGKHPEGSQIASQKATVKAMKVRVALGTMAAAFAQLTVSFSRIDEKEDEQ